MPLSLDGRQVRADLLEDAVFAIVREAARDPELLAEAVEEANRMAQEQVAPARNRVDALRRELAEVEDEGQRTLRQILSSGVADSALARSLLADIEARREALRASLAAAEGELSARNAEQLDVEHVAQALRGFDTAFDHLTAAEKREFLQLLIHRATVHPDHVDVALYDGRQATRYLAQVSRNGRVIAPPEDVRAKPTAGFAAGAGWHPTAERPRTEDGCGVVRFTVRFPEKPRKAIKPKRRERVRGPERWREWQRMLDEGVYASRAELARGVGVSTAAVSQGLRKLGRG